MTDTLQSQLHNLHHLLTEAAPTDPKAIRDFAWIVAKQLNTNTKDIDSLTCRQLLADCMRLPIERPSNLYSALLSAAIKVSHLYPDFRFAAFLNMWDLHNLRPEDHQRQQAPVSVGSPAAKTFPSLSERTAKAVAHSLILHPEDELTEDLVPLLKSAGYQLRSSSLRFLSGVEGSSSLTHPMLVTRIKQATGKDGRKYTFVTLTSPEGLEVETISHTLQPSPLHPLHEGKRHYVNIGQLYDCLLRISPSSTSTLKAAYLSPLKPSEVFPTEIGYIESIDQQHAHIHIYDTHSRHFVAPILRFSREKAGDFIRFIPIIPAASKFKTAIILSTIPSTSEEVQSILRDIRILNIYKEKAYATWELTAKTHPITELLSPLQLSQGETSPSFTSGYLHLTEDALPKVPFMTFPSPQVSSSYAAGVITPGQTLRALIYLKRGRDRQKRPHIALLFE